MLTNSPKPFHGRQLPHAVNSRCRTPEPSMTSVSYGTPEYAPSYAAFCLGQFHAYQTTSPVSAISITP
jgi:hypothetical protein